jgi:tRNA (Thr-GGU) A37 N-methylase
MNRGMLMKEIIYVPIGIIHSPFNDIKGMPIQPTGASGIAGTIEIDPEYVNGLKDIEGFSHIILIYTRTPKSYRNICSQACKSKRNHSSHRRC